MKSGLDWNQFVCVFQYCYLSARHVTSGRYGEEEALLCENISYMSDLFFFTVNNEKQNVALNKFFVNVMLIDFIRK